jgi:MinD superfamily P-loop ATPase
VIVAIASGKGGTGKTTVAVNLALTLPGEVQLLDCDVEAPNDHLFLQPRIDRVEEAGIPVPRIDADLCTECGQCAELCAYNALASLRTGVVVFGELCHGCGGCARVCPEDAITEVLRPIGVVEEGRAGRVRVVQGRLNVGEAQAPPLIRAVRARTDRSCDTVLVDSPPGTSCPMVAAVRGADLAVLVTEPTPFGHHDLVLAVEAVRTLGVPAGVVINRSDSGDRRVHQYCAAEGLEVLLEIPDDRRVAEACARGERVVEAVPSLRPLFAELARRIQEAVSSGSPGAEGARHAV